MNLSVEILRFSKSQIDLTKLLFYYPKVKTIIAVDTFVKGCEVKGDVVVIGGCENSFESDNNPFDNENPAIEDNSVDRNYKNELPNNCQESITALGSSFGVLCGLLAIYVLRKLTLRLKALYLARKSTNNKDNWTQDTLATKQRHSNLT